jgi:hypothetical protein
MAAPLTLDEQTGELDRLADALDYLSIAERAAAIDHVLGCLAHVVVNETPLDYEVLAHARMLATTDPSDTCTLRRELHELVRKSMIAGTPSSP